MMEKVRQEIGLAEKATKEETKTAEGEKKKARRK
jgi:hypothetical protein